MLLNREHELRPRWEEGHVQLYTRQCPVTLARLALGPRRKHYHSNKVTCNNAPRPAPVAALLAAAGRSLLVLLL